MENENLTKEEIESEDAPENLAMHSSVIGEEPPAKKSLISKIFSFFKNLFTFKFLKRNKENQNLEMNLGNEALIERVKLIKDNDELQNSESKEGNKEVEKSEESKKEDESGKEETKNQESEEEQQRGM